MDWIWIWNVCKRLWFMYPLSIVFFIVLFVSMLHSGNKTIFILPLYLFILLFIFRTCFDETSIPTMLRIKHTLPVSLNSHAKTMYFQRLIFPGVIVVGCMLVCLLIPISKIINPIVVLQALLFILFPLSVMYVYPILLDWYFATRDILRPLLRLTGFIVLTLYVATVGMIYVYSEIWWWLQILFGLLTVFQLVLAYRWSPILYQTKSELLRRHPAIVKERNYSIAFSQTYTTSWWDRTFDNPYKTSLALLALFAGFALMLIFGLPLCWELGLYVLDVDLENSDYMLGWMNLMYVILLILLVVMHRKNVLFMSSLRAYATLPMKKNRIFLMIVGFPLLGLLPFILYFFSMLARFQTPLLDLLNLMGTYLTTTYFTGAVLIWSVFAFQFIENKKYAEIAGVIWLSVVVGMLSAFSMIKPSDQSHQLGQLFVTVLIAIISLVYIFWALHYRSTPFRNDRM